MIYRFYRIYDAYSIAKLSFSCLISYFSYRFITNWKQKVSYLNTICQNMDSAEKHVMAHTTYKWRHPHKRETAGCSLTALCNKVRQLRTQEEDRGTLP